MTAEVWDLVVDRHRSPMRDEEGEGGRLVKVAECPPPGDGWTWRGLTLEDGFEIGHWIRRKAAKRDE